MKVKQVLPKDKLKHISIQDIVYWSPGADGEGGPAVFVPPSLPSRPQTVEESTQTFASSEGPQHHHQIMEPIGEQDHPHVQNPISSILGARRPTNVGGSSFKKGKQSPTQLGGPFGLKNKHKYYPGIDKQVETDASLFEDYLESRQTNISVKLANNQIDQVVGEEMKKTIVTLNDFL